MEIPDDVQEDLKEVCVTEAKANRKTMHMAVNAMAESLKMWQGHTASFQSQEALLTERIQQAKDAFVQARDTMNAAKIDAANMVPVDAKSAQSISDDEECKDLKDVPMAAAERIASGLTSLVETMSALHHQTEELVQE